jgi:hypothetical protein
LVCNLKRAHNFEDLSQEINQVTELGIDKYRVVCNLKRSHNFEDLSQEINQVTERSIYISTGWSVTSRELTTLRISVRRSTR